MAKGKQVINSDFYCLNCGKRGIPLMRKKSHLHPEGHRKKLYCPNCKKEVNHVEVRSFSEKEQFLQDFNNGKFKEEAQESINYILKESKIGD